LARKYVLGCKGRGEGDLRNIAFFLVSNFCRVLNAVCFLLGNSPASEFYVRTFRNTLFLLHRRIGIYLSMKMEQCVPKRRHIKFRRREITQKKAHNCSTLFIMWFVQQNTASLYSQ
jgi:hypothetical protein